ncbi:DNA polymerase [Aureimonas ureilytica]|uniref:Type-5 uracil-DNA glycosylase n=1 Tax=Aureimonas ureilytica TaxID=401562 RepID=A0A175R293_9HYPH|nr:DNA polymerase [Aureimonas ureilytica]
MHPTEPDQAAPPHDCPICSRLAAFRQEWREREPGWHNGPVRSFLPPEGPDSVRLLVVGLAPGVRGANRTGRPFTGDYAGDLLYATLKRFGFASGEFEARPDDSLRLVGAAITNAVRCVPPENKPNGQEINDCRRFLVPTIESFPRLSAIVTLGRIAHDSTLRALGAKPKDAPFSHGGAHEVSDRFVVSSYHCSRYNTNTGRLTEAMFADVFETVAKHLGQDS